MDKIKAFFASIDWATGLGFVVGTVWRWLKALPKKIWDSIWAFVGSPKVWLAAALFAIAGYFGGHYVASRHVTTLKADLKLRDDQFVANSATIAALNRVNADLKERLSKATPAPAASPAPVAAPAASPAPVAAPAAVSPPVVQAKAVARKAKPAPAKPVPLFGGLF
jgi:hypothetical protein